MSNLATLPAAERQRIEADKIACLIRKKTEGMGVKARKAAAKEMLLKLEPGMRSMVLEQMGVRADGESNRD